jgi:hypothetical protein
MKSDHLQVLFQVQLKEFVQTLEQHDFNRKMDEIYYGIVLLKQLGLLEVFTYIM